MRSLFIMLLVAASGTVTAQYNLGFENISTETDLPQGWGGNNVEQAKFPTDSLRNAFAVDNRIVHGGIRSFSIDWKSTYGDWTACNYVIAKKVRGKKIKLTGYMKTENVTGAGAGLWMRLDGVSSAEGFDNMSNRSVKGTTDWQKYTIELSYDGSKVKQVVVGGLIIGAGKIWLDDLQVTVDGVDISDAKLWSGDDLPASKDRAFASGSGIDNITLSPEKITQLTNLGMLWGFIKYYHSAVAKGNVNMDAALFRVLPNVLAASTSSDAYRIMEEWIDHIGTHDECKNCKPLEMDKNTKLMPDYGYLFDKNNLPQSLITKLERIKANRNEVKHHYYNNPAPYVGNPWFDHEEPYDFTQYPDAGLRLLALYRYWNIIQYFFPDRHLIGEDWNKVLSEFVPQFVNAGNALEYQLTCQALISRIHDTHASIWGGADSLNKARGGFSMPFAARFVENKLVVTDYYLDMPELKQQVKPGDIIEKIDGEPVGDLVKKYLPYVAASNYETQLRNLSYGRGPLLRSTKPQSTLTINRDGTQSDITVSRVPYSDKISAFDHDGRHTEGFRLLSDSIGYIYPGKLTDSDFKRIKEQFAGTKGIVIDMRCYPSSWMTFDYPGWFNDEPRSFVTFTGGDVTWPGHFSTSPGPRVGKTRGDKYGGKIVIIVNEWTQSSAEYQAMALSTARNAKVIGSTTAGADGNVSGIILPGGISTMISGIGILYPDGTETQRAGLRLDKTVKPTIKGIKEGRDEPLEEALKIINS